MKMKKLFTSEQVGIGHPDKICDQISDAILDEFIKQDKYSRVACETFAKNYNIVVGGEITSNAHVNVEEIIYRVLKDRIGLSYASKYAITNLIDKQSSDISMGVDIGGAGDQGIMFGYATSETTEYMPLAWSIATRALVKLNSLKNEKILPDSKAQVTLDYSDNITKIETMLISTQHTEDIEESELEKLVHEIMIDTAKEFNMNDDFKKLVNPTGRFVIGGTIGDAGLTGRKIIADTYGGYARHGGGAFSGKDPTKVDRSAAYMARYIAKNIVAAGLADKCEIQLSYAIGVAQPVSIMIETFNTEKVDKDKILECVIENLDLTPKGIIEKLDLRKPIYLQTSVYGHFGHTNIDLNWEKLDFSELLKDKLL